MKLYATVTSERATKGQGGNDYLDIRLSVSNDRIEAGRIIVEPSGTGYKVYFIPPAGITKADGVTLSEITAEYIEIKKKGEKQKGEKICDICNIRHAENGNLCEYCKNII